MMKQQRPVANGDDVVVEHSLIDYGWVLLNEDSLVGLQSVLSGHDTRCFQRLTSGKALGGCVREVRTSVDKEVDSWLRICGRKSRVICRALVAERSGHCAVVLEVPLISKRCSQRSLR